MAKKDKEPDPDRLVRESAGAYRSEDGRFMVRSAGGPGRWYVTDTERHDQLGLELVIGPFETLDEVRPAIVTQRDAPEASLPPAPQPEPEGDARPTRRGRTKATSKPEPAEPEAPEPEPEPEPAARPVSRVQLARWRKRGDQRDEVAAALRRLTVAWTSAQPEEAADVLDPEAVYVQSGLGDRLTGRDAAIASYRQFLETSVVHEYEERDLQVDVVGATAVATYGFRIEWESEGERHVDRGHDLFVFARADGAWRAVWRTMIMEGEQ